MTVTPIDVVLARRTEMFTRGRLHAPTRRRQFAPRYRATATVPPWETPWTPERWSVLWDNPPPAPIVPRPPEPEDRLPPRPWDYAPPPPAPRPSRRGRPVTWYADSYGREA